nr:MAG TPA: hypothetical protein [Caudoviricetes sp.]
MPQLRIKQTPGARGMRVTGVFFIRNPKGYKAL